MKNLILFLYLLVSLTHSLSAQNQLYELRVYDMSFFRPVEILETYLEKALIPGLNRHGVEKVGVFREIGEALPDKIYLVIPYKTFQNYVEVTDALRMDKQFAVDADAYWKASPEEIAFTNYESTFIRSVSGFPELVKPGEDSELFELRIYESYNEDALRRKVKMFNESEFKIFKDVGLPMVFFGENISGKQMPCLTYLLAFKNKEHHQEAWAEFGPHPEWQRIIKLDEYKNAMNDITRIFLKPLSYSQL